jgi:4-hydroxybenzoate polyprenyltransferase
LAANGSMSLTSAQDGAGGLAAGPDVRLEGEIILSDVKIEALLLTLRDQPLRIGEALGLARPSPTLPFDPAALRYDWALVEALRRRHAAGEPVVIASALPLSWQNAIHAHLGLSGASEGAPVPERSDAPSPTGLMVWLKALRLHQWTKNALVFVPLIMAHQFFDAGLFFNTTLAFICFGMVASSIYLMNDLMDLRQDRRHPTKRHRPFASGALPVRHGLVAFPLLLAGAALIAAQLPPLFSLAMAAYLALNLSYTFYLKRKLLVDVIALSGAYTLRILAGNAAGPVELSNWLLAFSMFLFFSLALVKRYVELDTVGVDPADEKRIMGRGYRRLDLDMLSQLGVASGFAAVVVLALFVEGAGKSGLYQHREMIWLVCPIVLYVICRIWVLAKRRELPDDPIMFILKDWRSHLMAAAVAVIFFFAA